MSRSEKVEIRLSAATKARWVEAAKGNVSDWIRRLAEEELSRSTESEAVSEQPVPGPGQSAPSDNGANEPSAADLPPAFGVALEEPGWRGPDPK